MEIWSDDLGTLTIDQYEQLVHRVETYMRRRIQTRVADEIAGEAVMEAILRALEGRYDGPIIALAIKIARNLVVDRQRGMDHRAISPIDWEAVPDPKPSGHVANVTGIPDRDQISTLVRKLRLTPPQIRVLTILSSECPTSKKLLRTRMGLSSKRLAALLVSLRRSVSENVSPQGG